MADQTIEKIKERLKVLTQEAATYQQQIWGLQWKLESVEAVMSELQRLCDEPNATEPAPAVTEAEPVPEAQRQPPPKSGRLNGRKMKPVAAIMQVLKESPNIDTAEIIEKLEGIVSSNAKHVKNTIYTTLYNMKKRGMIAYDEERKTYRLN